MVVVLPLTGSKRKVASEYPLVISQFLGFEHALPSGRDLIAWRGVALGRTSSDSPIGLLKAVESLKQACCACCLAQKMSGAIFGDALTFLKSWLDVTDHKHLDK